MKNSQEVEKLVAELKNSVKALEEKKTQSEIVQSTVVGNRSGSDEQKLLRTFGAKDVSQLIKVNVADSRIATLEQKAMVMELKKAVDTARFISQQFYGDAQDTIGHTEETDRFANCKNMLTSHFGKEVLAPMLKSFGSGISGGGFDYIPTLISSNYIPEYELDRLVEGRMEQVKMPSNPYKLSKTKNITKARVIAENTAITDRNFGTDVITFTSKKLGEYYILPEELTEDSAPDIYAIAREEVMAAQSRAMESSIINSDNDGLHLDSDTQALGSDVAEKAFAGLRRQALLNSANGGTVDFTNAIATETGIRSMRAKMKRFGVNPLDCLLLCGPAVYQQLVSLPSVATLEKFGPMATVLKGALTAYQGIPIVVSEYMREDMNATGVYDGVTFNRGGLLLLNTKRWYVGTRRPVVMKVMQDLAFQDRWLVASYQRKDFQGHVQSATEVSVVYGVNIAV